MFVGVALNENSGRVETGEPMDPEGPLTILTRCNQRLGQETEQTGARVSGLCGSPLSAPPPRSQG